jgi:hypothetical protein
VNVVVIDDGSGIGERTFEQEVHGTIDVLAKIPSKLAALSVTWSTSPSGSRGHATSKR